MISLFSFQCECSYSLVPTNTKQYFMRDFISWLPNNQLHQTFSQEGIPEGVHIIAVQY